MTPKAHKSTGKKDPSLSSEKRQPQRKPHDVEAQPEDPIDEAAMESFPASDPPTFTGSTATPSARSEDDE